MPSTSGAQIRAEKKDIRPGQVWTSRGEEIPSLTSRTDQEETADSFPVPSSTSARKGSVRTDAARIRMDWHPSRKVPMVGQLELFSCR